jgi:hypothetical protein
LHYVNRPGSLPGGFCFAKRFAHKFYQENRMTITTSSISETLHVYDIILQTIDKTPLIRLKSIANRLPCPLYTKVKLLNPGGSIKDLTGLNIITEAEQSGVAIKSWLPKLSLITI